VAFTFDSEVIASKRIQLALPEVHQAFRHASVIASHVVVCGIRVREQC